MSPSTPGTVTGKAVLVTGGSGFLGPALCRLLASRGARVRAVSRRVEPGERDGITWIRGDFSDPDDARRIVGEVGPDLVFHMAGLGLGAPRLDLVIPTFESNLVTTVNLLTAVAEEGDAKVVIAGSMEEPDDAHAVASSPYAASKWAGSIYARMFHGLFGLRTVVARIFMAYGPGVQSRKKLVPWVVESLLQNCAPELSAGTRPIDWIFVEDVADGLVRLAETEGLDGETVDIGSGRLVTVREMVERLVEVMGASAEPLFGTLDDRPIEEAKVADADRTFELMGWRAPTSLDDGLRRTIDYYADLLAREGAAEDTRAG